MNLTLAEFKDVISSGHLFALPSDELQWQMAQRPWDIQEKAWLVIFNGALLTATSPDSPENIALTKKFKWNVFLALNDAKLLLEPGTLNIQALILLATHVQDFATPSLCWMLVSTACRMLQAMGLDRDFKGHQVDSQRQLLFWSVHTMDKSLALISRKPPVLYTVTTDTAVMPSMEALLAHSPHESSDPGSPDLHKRRESPFGARYLYQSFLMADVMYKIWQTISAPHRDESSISRVQHKLWEWYKQTDKVKTVLSRCSMATD